MSRTFAAVLPCVLAAALLAAGPAQAGGRDELTRFVNDVKFFEARFEQTQTDEGGDVLQSSSGQMWLARPGKFRWDYRQPYEQLMVCDGERVWLYDPDLQQVTVRDAAAALQGTPAALLSQGAQLSDEFVLEDAGDAEQGSRVRLTPKSADSDFKSIELAIRAGVPQRMRFHDQLGGTTEIVFSDIRTGVRADADLFRFTPPAGVEVVDSAAP